MASKQSYTDRAETLKQQKLLTGIISDRFPKVSGIVIQMTYFQEGINPVLMIRTVNVFPKDSADFKMCCMIKGCLNGGFNLTKPITDLIKKRKSSGKGQLSCRGKVENHASCKASISYEVKIKYNK